LSDREGEVDRPHIRKKKKHAEVGGGEENKGKKKEAPRSIGRGRSGALSSTVGRKKRLMPEPMDVFRPTEEACTTQKMWGERRAKGGDRHKTVEGRETVVTLSQWV